MIDDIRMEDLGAKGQVFNWSNNRTGDERVYERLNRVLTNSKWATYYMDDMCINEL